MDTSQPLSSAISQRAHELNGRDRDYAWAQQHGFLPTKAELTTATAQSANNRDQH